jgi:hypothetical protein
VKRIEHERSSNLEGACKAETVAGLKSAFNQILSNNQFETALHLPNGRWAAPVYNETRPTESYESAAGRVKPNKKNQLRAAPGDPDIRIPERSAKLQKTKQKRMRTRTFRRSQGRGYSVVRHHTSDNTRTSQLQRFMVQKSRRGDVSGCLAGACLGMGFRPDCSE